MSTAVDVLIPMPDLICSAFVVETLLPLLQEPVLKRLLLKPSMRAEYSRDILLHEFLKGTSEYVFITDADMILPPHTLGRLLWHKKKMITGLYFGRGEKAYPIIFEVEPLHQWPKTRYFFYPQNQLIEVGATGHGCLLIHRSVLEALEPPYSQLGPFDGEPLVGSDLRLCLKARKEAGVKIWCDTSIKCGHLHPDPITEATWERGKVEHIEEWEEVMERMKQREAKK